MLIVRYVSGCHLLVCCLLLELKCSQTICRLEPPLIGCRCALSLRYSAQWQVGVVVTIERLLPFHHCKMQELWSRILISVVWVQWKVFCLMSGCDNGT